MMPELKDVFNIKSEGIFQEKCLEVFRYQYQNVEVYKKFVDFLGRDVSKIQKIEEIPFLPIEIFKNHQVLDKDFQTELFFQSSGTTQINRSKHWIADEDLYKKSIVESFKEFIGEPKDYVILGLLPNYSENKNSSLIYMVDFLMQDSGQKENDYFLYNHQELFHLLNNLNHKKILLFGVSFALLDFLDFVKEENFVIKNEQLTIIETGGMKGRKEEITKDELLKIFRNGFNTNQIFSEYSMTELLSQAYSLGKNLYQTPNWMRILIRNTEDPFQYVETGKTGAINIIDLANLHSCSFLATQDLGKIERTNDKEFFSVLGRIDYSDIRGCSLLVS
ncbi:LuxE/PaaK family acyltransferase [Frigoriflavimonas asaccharolytica]|uniref:Acyl-protein synthetase LuxE domain-containing protein n=1 Tax=Frigoriflavimonas asaccharolytica TaxID=2735899 RepID=A0A8J8G761_9FLAO|nr:acyl transferase [Frigoriflavimonas asaccharolytica]NRS91940.1 hypothetical protein [Frigoriflavimonas asaccharolytica]